ncbi:MAG: hypothetical protein ACLUKN_03455 [Bacilli bacterium]
MHVVYGIVGFKTHCKTCLIVRRIDGMLKRYVHLGTETTIQRQQKFIPTCLFHRARRHNRRSCKPVQHIDGKSKNPIQKLWVAPFCFHSKFIDMVKREIAHAKAANPPA